MPYKLSASLLAHTSDVRAVVSPSDDLVLSASRDTTAISWSRQSLTSSFKPAAVYKAGTRYVNSIAYVPPIAEAPLGYVVTGGQDTVINVFILGEGNKEDPDFSLLGHSENVCALSAAPAGNTLISGSWDQTARVWKNFQLAFELKGHQQSVWAVLILDDEHFLTGSADKTIKLWNRHKNVQTFQGHKDAVRGLACIPDIGFASCSNDSEIRVWTLSGDPIYTLSGHTSFVYSLATLPNGDIVSGGEDRTVRVWQDGECAQTIVHPSLSVWTVSTMPNGDIVSGCSDGAVRVFSTSSDRWASNADLKAYEDLVASQALPAQQLGDIKKTDLPGMDALSVSGKKPGEVKMIKNGELVEAHQWDAATSSWQKIGDVVDAVGQGRKQLFEGKEYDYVFDVDIAEGAPPLKLPYNVTDNPYTAAQRFLERNDLPSAHLDTVAQFIEKNTSGVNIGNGGNEYIDPFTGASRYRASASASPLAPTLSTNMNAALVDPYASTNRHSGTTPSGTFSQAPKSGGVIPVSKFLHFKNATVSAMQGKLYQFDDGFRNEISTYSLALYPKELSLLDETFSYLSQVVSSPSESPTFVLGPAHLEAIIQILDRWPESQRFPVIDLSRLVVGYCPDAFATPGLRERLFDSLLNGSDWTSPWTTPLSKLRETNVLLLLRTVANSFQEDSPVNEGTWVMQALDALNLAPYQSLNKGHRVAVATVLFNLSCVSLSVQVEPAIRFAHLNLILKMLQTEKTDSESAYRALVALGNVVYVAKTTGEKIEDVLLAQARELVQALPLVFTEERIRVVSGEVGELLH